MIDIHSHILPEIDDGAKNWDEALTLCQMAHDDGTRVMVATPHVFNGSYPQRDRNLIQDYLNQLREKVREKGIDLEILGGAEVHCRPDVSALLANDPALTLNGNGHYFLLEFPHSLIPPHADRFISELRSKDFIPIVAHPERNVSVQKNTKVLEGLVRLGAFCQVTAMSVVGEFGQAAQKCALELLRKNCVHLIASDTHNKKGRPPILSRARGWIEREFGREKACDFFEKFPQKVLGR